MIVLTKPYFLVIALIIFVSFSASDGKRGGGGRRGGSSRGSSSVWGRNKQQSQTLPANYDLYGSGQKKSKTSQPAAQPEVSSNTHKASAPSSPEIQKTSVGDSSSAFIQHEKKQQSPLQNEQQRPIGWDINKDTKMDGNINKNTGWNVANSNQQSGAPAYAPSGYYGATNTGHQPPGYYGNTNSYPATNTGHQPPGYYGNVNSYPSINAGHQPQFQNPYPNGNPGVSYPTNVGHQLYPNTGVNPQYGYGNSYQQQHFNPNYPNSNFGPSPPGYYNTNQGGGIFGNLFGGKKHGYGGFGGMGGYGKQYGGGFGSGFGKNAYRNAFFGLLIWNLVSGLTRRPYYVYNYYNNPEKIPQDIPLPANIIVLCPDNITSLCAPNTAPLCTTNETILCVALAQQAVPCGDNSSLKCISSNVTCTENGDSACNDTKTETKTSSISIPCITNATITGKVDNSAISFSGTSNLDETTTLCVTTLAQPQPEDDIKLCASQGNTTCVGNQNEQYDQNLHGLAM